ncbi:ribonuclease HII [Candidatus Saccharibacteria bacterium]|nr:ribonuclease HII [Candidatus Saccharibacteria bacterium]
MILGIDEVGRGPWAGPLVMGAVVLGGVEIDGLTDSKKLTKKKRDVLDPIIREQALGYGLGWVSAMELDEIGMSEALVLACKRAVQAVDTLGVAYSEIVIDGTINFLQDTSKGKYVKTMPKADLLVPSVSAASIIAKVARDNYMTEQDTVYPGYKFGSHAGYGTATHRAAIEQLGVTPLHRLSFAPLEKYRSIAPLPSPQALVKNPTKRIGDDAEEVAADYLRKNGHEILERNWKTKYCEIDIVSRHRDITYFTEVKYRRQANQGGGIAAITPKKLKQMEFAVAVYKKSHSEASGDLRLAVASLSGEPPELEQWFALD